MKDDAKSALRAARGWKLCYLASPYRNYPKGHWPAVVEVSQAAARLMARHGVKCFSPISHGYAISQYGNIDSTNNEFWAEVNRPFVDACEGLLVYEMTGWDVSEGVAGEIAAFVKAGKPIVHLKPDDLE